MVVHKKNYRIPIGLLVFGMLLCIASAIVFTRSTGDWFMRSGAVLSFVSVAVQLILTNFKIILHAAYRLLVNVLPNRDPFRRGCYYRWSRSKQDCICR